MQHNTEAAKLIQAASYFQPTGAMIAGGALTSIYTGQQINDVDLYFKSQEAFCRAVEAAYDDGLWCAAATDRAVTFVRDNNIIQLMHFGFFADAAAVFDAFDFTCCMAAFDLDTKEFVFHDDFLKHASQRHLSFHSGTRYPFGSLLRVLKYQARGYSIGKGDLLRIALACRKVELASWDDLAAAIGGQYGERVSLDGEGDFNIDAAMDVIAKGDFAIQAKGEDMPADADQLLDRIGLTRALAA